MKKKDVARKMLRRVSEFNREAEGKYNEAVKSYEPGKGGFPHKPMYTYEKKRGYVVSWEHPRGGKGSRYFHRKKDAEQYHQSEEV